MSEITWTNCDDEMPPDDNAQVTGAAPTNGERSDDL